MAAGEQPEPDRKPDGASQHRCGKAVQNVLGQYLPAGETDCLQRADLGAVLLHQPRHGGQRHQQGDQEEEYRENVTQCRHLADIALVAGKAGVVLPRAE